MRTQAKALKRTVFTRKRRLKKSGRFLSCGTQRKHRDKRKTGEKEKKEKGTEEKPQTKEGTKTEQTFYKKKKVKKETHVFGVSHGRGPLRSNRKEAHKKVEQKRRTQNQVKHIIEFQNSNFQFFFQKKKLSGRKVAFTVQVIEE